jgi:hypothetical protein
MVRRCCVDDCNETDLSILSHRFPKSQSLAEKWRDALKITSISVDQLQKGSYVVCTKHFKGSDYRNEISNCLNTTAVPNLSDNSSNNERFITTKDKEKSKQATQLRCHKILLDVTPSPVINKFATPRIKVFNEIPLKKLKLASSKIKIHSHDLIPVKKEPKNKMRYMKEEVTANSSNCIEDVETCLEPSTEVIEHPEQSQIKSSFTYTIAKNVQEDQAALEDQSTMTDSIEKVHQEVQVNLEAPSSAKPSDTVDKMIKLLYPKYAGLSKMELVKALVERDLKISSLEEKEKQLEEILTKMI